MAGQVVNPSFLTSDGSYRNLYAVSETEGRGNGGVAAFSIDRKTGLLKSLNHVSSEGQAPCHLAVDKTGKMLVVANYGTGSVSAYPIESDGRLGKMSALMTAHGSSVNPKRQEGPHAHETVISKDNRLLYVPDLGLDEIRMYNLEPSTAKLIPANPPFSKVGGGFGPRHIAFSSDEKFAYVANELKSFVTIFTRNASDGSLHQIQEISTVPPGFAGDNAPAEIVISDDGKFVYASNRGDNSIAVFARDPGDGKLSEVEIVSAQGNFPRGMAIDPTGHFLFAGNQKSNQFAVFRVNPENGRLTATGQKFDASAPVAFLFVPISE